MELLSVGKIVKPQGIKGEVKIYPLIDIPAIFNGKHEMFIDKKPVKVKSCSFRQGFAYAMFEEIPDRNTAEKYRNSLVYIDKEELQHCFTEFEPYFGKCKFTGCSHRKELGCLVRQAVEEGIIAPSRYESYLTMYEEASKVNEWERR